MANIIVCCDGTWNTPDQQDNGQPSPTNVVKIRAAIAGVDAGGTEQKTYYRKGVGTSGGRLRRLIGGAVGKGLSNDVKSAYKWLCETYQDNDRQPDDIFMFGFSRGSFAVRSLAGLIGRCGLLRFDGERLSETEKWRRVDRAYGAYRELEAGEQWQTSYHRRLDVQIRFLGVWDTVGALGIPEEFGLKILEGRVNGNYRFHDTDLGDNVTTARHALALDERRQTFAPTLWTNDTPDRDIKQVWFTGVHGDVGGSYANDSLGDIALGWMMDEAADNGLAFRSEIQKQLKPDFQGVLHNSVTGFFAKLRTRPRSIPSMIGTTPDVHPMARKRHIDPPLVQPYYWPTKTLAKGASTVINVFAREHWNSTGVFLEAGVTYDFTANGEWLDAWVKCTPAGPPPGFQLGSLGYWAAAPSDFLQAMSKKRTKDDGAIVYGARRREDLPWFSLVGVIADGSGVDPETQKLNTHTEIGIGLHLKHTPQKSGYLYCYANDVWGFYGNNKGGVRLKVTRD